MSRRTAAHSITYTCEVAVKPGGRAQPPPERAAAANGHVHLGVALHRAEPAALGLLARLADERAA